MINYRNKKTEEIKDIISVIEESIIEIFSTQDFNLIYNSLSERNIYEYDNKYSNINIVELYETLSDNQFWNANIISNKILGWIKIDSTYIRLFFYLKDILMDLSKIFIEKIARYFYLIHNNLILFSKDVIWLLKEFHNKILELKNNINFLLFNVKNYLKDKDIKYFLKSLSNEKDILICFFIFIIKRNKILNFNLKEELQKYSPKKYSQLYKIIRKEIKGEFSEIFLIDNDNFQFYINDSLKINSIFDDGIFLKWLKYLFDSINSIISIEYNNIVKDVIYNEQMK